MKNTFRVTLFLLAVISILYVFKDYLGGWVLGILSVLFPLSVLFIAFLIFFENRHPTRTLTWLVVLGSFPVLGFIFYILFGRNVRKQRLFQKKALLDKHTAEHIEGHRSYSEEEMKLLGNEYRSLFQLSKNLGRSPISFATETRVLTDGDETFSKIIEELEKANHHIHLEYYIVRHDDLGNKIKNILIKKAKEGVIVRFLYDAVGSFKLSNKYINDLKEAGVQIVPFSPVRFPVFNNKINFRNHRKIIVIDGNIGFVGGLNIGDEYLGKDKYFGYWRDTHLYVKGKAVRSLQLIFLQDWYYMTEQSLLSPEYLSPKLQENINHGGVQMIAGGPDQEWEVIKNLFFAMITSARKTIWIASPYFIPDDDIFSALKVAALSGVDVRLLMPSRPDKKIVFYASRSYFPELMEAGVKVFEYEKGFLHSKVIIVDEEVASIGTANMDMRSFHLNFEVNAFLYNTKSLHKLVEDYEDDIKNSKPIVKEVFANRPFYQRIMESLCRLTSPLL
ncbi:cardiolipin synthase [Sutcliffiella cohnii]|uniref:Cardiolipin synthase n=1 Tax=Sutcliffiella cohnii TaxID=33932 RepID=A0A223KM94_9BACI|nr:MULTISPECIES: cardiolipin synthase [Sutcliffiella]AST90615.1 cardiolipin synthase [Sutcliffiella cohnii]MED4016902.1 cardiolipin synthase [Sutcliffiella cohnii]WBL16266.1 cardiolipin synthase [Sutcliffiella sp. NC1]